MAAAAGAASDVATVSAAWLREHQVRQGHANRLIRRCGGSPATPRISLLYALVAAMILSLPPICTADDATMDAPTAFPWGPPPLVIDDDAPCLLTSKERNKLMHALNGNTSADGLTPAATQHAIVACMTNSGWEYKPALKAYADLIHKASRDRVQDIAAVRSLDERTRQVNAALARHQITLDGMAISAARRKQPPARPTTGSSQPSARQQPQQYRRPYAGPYGRYDPRDQSRPPPPKERAHSRPPPSSQRRATGDALAAPLPPQQLVASKWNAVVCEKASLDRTTGSLTGTQGQRGGVAWISSASDAASLAQDLHDCDGALALVTRRPIPKPKNDGAPAGYWAHEHGVDVRFIRPNPPPPDGSAPAPPRHAFLNCVITQLGKIPVAMSRSPDTSARDANDELVTALRVVISEAGAKKMKPVIVQSIDAARPKDREDAICKAARDWVIAKAPTDVKEPVHSVFRSRANKEHSLDASGKRLWTVTVKVRSDAVNALYRAAGTDGISATGADSIADKAKYAAVPLDLTADAMDKACLKVERTPNTHGVIIARAGSLYARCLHEHVDAVRRDILGDEQAARLRCSLYEVSHIPRDLTDASVHEQLMNSPGGFADGGCTRLEPVENLKWDRATKTYKRRYRADQPPTAAMPLTIGPMELLVQTVAAPPKRPPATARPNAWLQGPPRLPAADCADGKPAAAEQVGPPDPSRSWSIDQCRSRYVEVNGSDDGWDPNKDEHGDAITTLWDKEARAQQLYRQLKERHEKEEEERRKTAAAESERNRAALRESSRREMEALEQRRQRDARDAAVVMPAPPAAEPIVAAAAAAAPARPAPPAPAAAAGAADAAAQDPLQFARDAVAALRRELAQQQQTRDDAQQRRDAKIDERFATQDRKADETNTLIGQLSTMMTTQMKQMSDAIAQLGARANGTDGGAPRPPPPAAAASAPPTPHHGADTPPVAGGERAQTPPVTGGGTGPY
eukprot:gene37002-3422_t